ncbi:G-type lectin S-receptor-like serine/threonine-protein kinase At4g27290 [Argentina anserina]|uniref:G-type lectin S-receptor-like serine/threonine-protein kinase At4g27290 n=1 Tax=Argentina anserina TaxID=57926 RepID=UPI0021768C21|nr:G-type lectin S-receptor-like serine/threonine-protein kinase At4g27290 [Potentilla anserina]
MEAWIIHLFIFCLLPILTFSAPSDTLSATESLKDGETIVSVGGSFELGFFSPGNSSNWYLGIWYKKISAGTVVWVANSDTPFNGSAGVLKFSVQKTLVLVDEANTTIWSANSAKSATAPVAQLLDTGNLVLRDYNDPETFLWQSFDYPCNTILPGMKYGVNLVTGLNRFLTSWKSDQDPSPGIYTNKLDTTGIPQFLLKKGSAVQFRSGLWNGLRFTGMPNLKPNPIYTYGFVFNEEEIYYHYQLINSTISTRLTLSPSGNLQRFTWIDRIQDWSLYLTAQIDDCDRYAVCGAYGSCNINNSPSCGCLEGFTPKSPLDWEMADWSHGCVRKTPLDCGDGEGFMKYSGIKLPDTQHSLYDKTMNLKECEQVCLKNCNCTAYASLDIRGEGSGCILWLGELIDTREFSDAGQDIYIRMAASELVTYRSLKGNTKVKIIILSVLAVGITLIGLCMILHVYKRKMKKKKKQKLTKRLANMLHTRQHDHNEESQDGNLELPLFSFSTIADATNNFSAANKLGKGGFGPVYKGKLSEGQEIGVKRLSKCTRQGIKEFKNEVLCISKLQHRNLVKLLGCCIEGQERLLIYEYMPNKSLDFFIFDEQQSIILDWPKRFHIISGIARGLLYLHQDSRLRIIHRDLKASNVLLDYELNPKISDFGIARSFGGDESEANTRRVVGTYGYMSPEYAIDGVFSVKSDVFSFGVLVLEIVSGKKNRGFSHPDHNLNLLGHAWRLFKEGKPFELMHTSMKNNNTSNMSEVLRSVHVALLCVQQSPEDRPNMSTVVLMLSSDDITLPRPKQPGFFTERHILCMASSSSQHEISSSNRLSFSLEAR